MKCEQQNSELKNVLSHVKVYLWICCEDEGASLKKSWCDHQNGSQTYIAAQKEKSCLGVIMRVCDLLIGLNLFEWTHINGEKADNIYTINPK